MINADFQPELCCPVCYHELTSNDSSSLNCISCKTSYPVIGKTPVLLNEQNSLFSIDETINGRGDKISSGIATIDKSNGGIKHAFIKFLGIIQRAAPKLTLNLAAKRNYQKFGELILQKSTNPKVLVVGGRILGEGMEDFVNLPITFVDTDIAFSPMTKVICDAHNLPFKDNYFDGVVLQAVLEHVVDPSRCMSEVHRVIKDEGLVYSETPFMQQVHMREYDFTRFTFLGHRRLFRNFEQIDAGATGGTGSALAWAHKYFLLSFSDKKIVREFLLILAAWTSFFAKYWDYITIKKEATLDGASGFYFLGRKSKNILSDRDLIKQYRGMF